MRPLSSSLSIFLLFLLGDSGLAAGSVATQSPPAGPRIQIELRPAAPVAGQLTELEVTVTTTIAATPSGGHLLVLPAMLQSGKMSADDVQDLTASDAAGTIPLTTETVVRSDDNSNRYWNVARPVSGLVRWHYRVATDPAQPLRTLPMYELRSSFGTISGSAYAFLLLPADEIKRRVDVRWELGALPDGTTAWSTFGRGNASSNMALTPAELSATYYMVRPTGAFAAPGSGFFAAWQGTPRFPIAESMEWAARLHRFYGEFFRDAKDVFGVFARSNDINPGSGNGFTNSFSFTFSDRTRGDDIRALLAHEMLHVWVESLDVEGGQDPLSTSWFGEGLAVYYERELPFRAGLISGEEFADDLNRTALRYYTDAKNTVPNDQIAPNFWQDTRIRVLPYDRGSLYFARLNTEIRRASRGAHTLDDLVRTLLAKRRAGRPLTTATWHRILFDELGQKGVDAWRAMMKGERIKVAPDDFGPCFKPSIRSVGMFDMGYDFVTTNAHGRIVRGLDPASNAAKAGLREGDHILRGGPGDAVQAYTERTVTLTVERDDRTTSITFLPRGKPVPVPQWIFDKTAEGCKHPAPAARK